MLEDVNQFMFVCAIVPLIRQSRETLQVYMKTHFSAIYQPILYIIDEQKPKKQPSNTFPQPPDSNVFYSYLLISQFSPLEIAFAFMMGT